MMNIDGVRVMENMKHQVTLAITALALVISGCDTGSNQVAGIDRGGYTSGAVGPIDGFGSVIVNGVRYGSAAASITISGQPATEAQLRIGYVVAIQADNPANGSGPQATTIDFNYDVIGPLSNVEVGLNQATVLGQLIVVNESTSYGSGIVPASIDGLAALLPLGLNIRVSGFRGATDEILATRIEMAPAVNELEVVGIASNVDTIAQTFGLDSLVVNYGSASINGFPGGQPANGDRVKVKATQFVAGQLMADEVELQEIDLGLSDGESLEIEGLITAISSVSAFNIGGFSVVTNSATQYKDGDASMLGLNVNVEVKGSLNASGVLVATEVEFEPKGDLRIELLAETVDAAGGTLTLLGIPVQVNSETVFEDKSPMAARPFDLAGINVGDPLRVVGFESASMAGTVIAIKIERLEKLEQAEIRGIAENVMSPNIDILGVTVVTNGATNLETDFFAQAAGRLVEAEGSVSGSSFLAQKIEIKN
jgi:hypothetical protein